MQSHSEACPSGEDCEDGWIPREMILGAEAVDRVPQEFITQRSNIANPPTFLLVVESLVDRFLMSDDCMADANGQAERAIVLGFVRDIFPRLHTWVQWFLRTQKSSHSPPQSPGVPLFRWKGRSLSDNKAIMKCTHFSLTVHDLISLRR